MNRQDTIVDLRSDTVTKPTPAMREAMAAAEVGDDVFGEDPTVNALEGRVAELVGKEAALFVPSGTMANLLAIMSQTSQGDALLLHEDSHPFNYESGNVSAVAGVMPRTLTGELGILDYETIRAHINPGHDHHFAPTTLISLENTTNRGGGNLYRPESMQAIRELADEFQIRVHLDGARIFNAVVASGHAITEYADHADTLSFCFSKGLGAPAGSILVGTSETIRRAHRFRKMLGGGMRQSGILAAAAQYALDHHIDRLADDHRRARAFRTALEGSEGIQFPLPSPTNIVYIETASASVFVTNLDSKGVRAIPVSETRVRFVFHLDIDDRAVDRVVDAAKSAIS